MCGFSSCSMNHMWHIASLKLAINEMHEFIVVEGKFYELYCEVWMWEHVFPRIIWSLSCKDLNHLVKRETF